MITELAKLQIKAGETSAFETALTKAKETVLPRAKGFIHLECLRCVENDHEYILRIHWATYEDHMEGFREGPLFAEWRDLIGAYFASAPDVKHYKSIA